MNSEILAGEFSRAGHSVRLLTWSAGDDKPDWEFDVVRQPTLSELIAAHRWSDVVYENNICLRLSWPAALFRKRSVIALRTWLSDDLRRNSLRKTAKSMWLRRANGVIAVSDSVRKRCWLPAEVIGNPYRHDVFVESSEIERNGDFVFLGRLVSDKGVDDAIAAFYEIRKTPQGRASTLAIIGDGPDRERLESTVKELGLTDSVTFHGALQGQELVSTLNRFKFIWIPSKWEEPFGNVALEGMACGCIPIASDGGGLPDAVGDAGIVFQRGNLESMIRESLALMQDRSRQQHYRDTAVSHLEKHRPSVVASKYLKTIENSVQLG
ncbi:2-deoxystreptamine glucosyltransferase [Stieleria neptunia]|uniref:2-deoxystreptamine glucosyltransferase n=1 Tax=Stieleria neptunia TaxID=2527979 RepID=A0A518HKD0_9BACT|nr:2-deoxystreptamine glucosyltransferase [Stieleria neptunia]